MYESQTLPLRSFRAPLVAAILVLAIILTAPFPGSLSIVATRALSSLAATPGVELLADVALAILASLTAIVVVRGWFRHREDRPLLAAAVIGVPVAYALSEGLKLVLAQPRPCMLWATGGACPAAGDWSLPSNHATLAFAAVVVIAVATRSTWIVAGAAALAAVVAGGRVMQGVHYLHDVGLGALLGLVAPVLLAVAVRKVVAARPPRDTPSSPRR